MHKLLTCDEIYSPSVSILYDDRLMNSIEEVKISMYTSLVLTTVRLFYSTVSNFALHVLCYIIVGLHS